MQYRYLFFTILFSISCVWVFGQQVVVDQDYWKDPDTRDFATIQQRMEEYYADRGKGRGSGYKQWKRWEYYMQNRLDEDGRITNVAARLLNIRQELDQSGRTHGGFWNEVAPKSWINGNSGYNGGLGRVNVIAFHPTNASYIYAGCPSGGLWRTTNGGSTWEPLTDGLPRIGISGIVVVNTNVIYILTGDGDGNDVSSVGVLKTTDGGKIWQRTGLTFAPNEFRRGYKLLGHPTNSNILFAAMTHGLFRTTDGGQTWTNERSDSFRDIEFKPGDPNTVYASTNNDFLRSTDGGDTWTTITSGLPTGENRVEIGVSPNNPSYVYVLCGPHGSDGDGTFKGVYRSFDSGLNFGPKASTPNILDSSLSGNDDCSDGCGQSGYDLAIAIDPDAVGTVITGGINIWKSTSFGNTGTFDIKTHWNTNTASNNSLEYSHADIHELVYNPLNGWLYCGSDGGVFRSTDDGETWTDLSSDMQIMQWYKIAGTEASTSLIIGGTQDNGSNEWDGGTSVDHMYGADGMDCMIDHSNSNIYYFSTQNGGLRKSTNGGSTSTSIKPSGSSGSWVTPYVMNPSNSSIIYGGYSDVYKSTNGGSSWSNVGVDGRGGLVHGTNNTNRLYAVSSSGNTIWMTNNAGSSWTDVSGTLPNGITSVTMNPNNSPDVFVTIGGFTAGQKVFRSTNAGTSWTNISGSLPNVPVNVIVYEDNDGSPDDALYIGTDIGVFYRDNTLGDWIPFTNGLPSVEVFDLEIHQTSNLIRAGTYGRGLWSSSTFTPCPNALFLTQFNNPGATNTSVGYQYYQSSDSISSQRIIGGGAGTSVKYQAANRIRLFTGFQAKAGIDRFQATLGPCGSGVPGDIGFELDNTDPTGSSDREFRTGGEGIGLIADKEDDPKWFVWNDNEEDVLMKIVSTSGSGYTYEETFTKGNTSVPVVAIGMPPGAYLVEVSGPSGTEQLRFRITEE